MVTHQTRSWSLACLLASALSMPAQTFVVDAAGGAGATFADLPAAIAAVPSGSLLLVRGGVYQPFSIVAKSLSIVILDPTNTSLANGVVRVASLGGGQAVHLLGLRLSFIGSARLELRDCTGVVEVADCNLPHFANANASIHRCANVRLSRVRFGDVIQPRGAPPALEIVASNVEIVSSNFRGGSKLASVGDGGPAVLITHGSHVTMHQCCVEGGSGLASGNGGPGLVVGSGSTVQFLAGTLPFAASSVNGGSGGNNFIGPVGNGGPGVVVEGSSRLKVFGPVVDGGVGGFGSGIGRSGPRELIDASSSYDWNSVHRTILATTGGLPAPGQTVEVRLHGTEWGPPSTTAILLLGTAAAYQVVPWLGCGVLGLVPIATVGPLVTPTGTFHATPIAVPGTTALGLTLMGQYVAIHPRLGTILASNTVAVTLR